MKIWTLHLFIYSHDKEHQESNWCNTSQEWYRDLSNTNCCSNSRGSQTHDQTMPCEQAGGIEHQGWYQTPWMPSDIWREKDQFSDIEIITPLFHERKMVLSHILFHKSYLGRPSKYPWRQRFSRDARDFVANALDQFSSENQWAIHTASPKSKGSSLA